MPSNGGGNANGDVWRAEEELGVACADAEHQTAHHTRNSVLQSPRNQLKGWISFRSVGTEF